jgi:hypothetical protein
MNRQHSQTDGALLLLSLCSSSLIQRREFSQILSDATVARHGPSTAQLRSFTGTSTAPVRKQLLAVVV